MAKGKKQGRMLENALYTCDELEDLVGAKKAAATALLTARLLAGSEDSFKALVEKSAAKVSWSEVEGIVAEGEDDPDDPDEQDEDEDDPEEEKTFTRPMRAVAGGR